MTYLHPKTPTSTLISLGTEDFVNLGDTSFQTTADDFTGVVCPMALSRIPRWEVTSSPLSSSTGLVSHRRSSHGLQLPPVAPLWLLLLVCGLLLSSMHRWKMLC